ncbi:MAG TPA: aspartate/glutamate racemase family protein [Gemmatimonadaceae bacterium]|nr:aspartate/glutamate racemase family protein [Gemmatimonadaceae bacterium]
MNELASHQRIALISATPAAIDPASKALRAEIPEVSIWNILDDTLLTDANYKGGLTPQLVARMQRLISHARAEGAAAILLTCSMYGAVAQDEFQDIPILAPDQAAFDELAVSDFGTVLVVASLESSLADSLERLTVSLEDAGSRSRLVGVFASDAMEATETGDVGELVSALATACRAAIGNADAIFLAQYSLAPAAVGLASALQLPVISGPRSAATRLGKALRSPSAME